MLKAYKKQRNSDKPTEFKEVEIIGVARWDWLDDDDRGKGKKYLVKDLSTSKISEVNQYDLYVQELPTT